MGLINAFEINFTPRQLKIPLDLEKIIVFSIWCIPYVMQCHLDMTFREDANIIIDIMETQSPKMLIK